MLISESASLYSPQSISLDNYVMLGLSLYVYLHGQIFTHFVNAVISRLAELSRCPLQYLIIVEFNNRFKKQFGIQTSAEDDSNLRHYFACDYQQVIVYFVLEDILSALG